LRADVRVELALVQRACGATMIFVTHDQSEALSLGERVAVMREGGLEQVATPRELYERPGQRVRRALRGHARDGTTRRRNTCGTLSHGGRPRSMCPQRESRRAPRLPAFAPRPCGSMRMVRCAAWSARPRIVTLERLAGSLLWVGFDRRRGGHDAPTSNGLDATLATGRPRCCSRAT
jgi:ABC-type dipeptide/oligopeptide/nickel transport system ATPase component